LQRLPPHRIQRAHEVGEITFKEDPALAGLGPWDEAALGSHANFLRVHVQERGGFVEGECPYRVAGGLALYGDGYGVRGQRSLPLRVEQRPRWLCVKHAGLRFSGRHIWRPLR
jgi:hypothetical protein